MKHCAALANDPDGLRSLHGLAREKLAELGISQTRSNLAASKKSRAFPSTPGKKALSTPSAGSSTFKGPNAVFGRPLRDLSPSSVIISGDSLSVPHFLVAVVNFLRKHLATDGLFRKAGSSGRQRALRAEIEESTTFYAPEDASISALDVASILKQWLRELPEPLVPTRFHETFSKCTRLAGDSKAEAVVLASLLLPPLHAASLSCLLRFLSEVAASSSENKMDSRSLAIVFTPGLFPVGDDVKNVEMTNADLANKLEVVEIMINHSESVCMVDPLLENALNIPTVLLTASEDNLDVSDTEAAPGNGPMSRRRKSKKKRRSGSLSRVFTATMKGLNKAIGRSTTTPSTMTDDEEARSSKKASAFPAKRKVSTEHELSPNTKHRKAAMESAFTPKVMRARSVSIKGRFKMKNQNLHKRILNADKAKEPSLVIHFDGNALPTTDSRTPLPNKSAISRIIGNTPGTPGSTGLPTGAGQDLSGHDVVDLASSPASSLASSTTSSASRKSSSQKRRDRKIGSRRPSTDSSARPSGSSLADQPNPNDSLAKNQLRRGKPNTFHVKPSPMKVVEPSRGGGMKTRIKISFNDGQLSTPRVSVRVNESLTSLKQDIGSMIEKSFGPTRQPDNSCDDEADGLDRLQDMEFALPHVTTRSSSLRRQSSAFEVSRTLGAEPLLGSSGVRGQSSAFELAAKASAKADFTRQASVRASLRQRNSSVKDLVKKMEDTTRRSSSSSSTLPKPSCLPPPALEAVDVHHKQPDQHISSTPLPHLAKQASSPDIFVPSADEWVEATDFFSKGLEPGPLPAPIEEASGCKRSSIIRIRTEKKGLVSRSVETFTKPLPVATPSRRGRTPVKTPVRAAKTLNPATKPVTPAQQPAPRRTSARMGVAAKAAATPQPSQGSRRQTLTGIRTTVDSSRRSAVKPAEEEPIYENGNVRAATSSAKKPREAKKTEPKVSPATSRDRVRKSKRLEGRRHLTIGYVGEVRSPLKDRANTMVVAKVQRSKSAQTPSQKAKRRETRGRENKPADVRRTKSLRSPSPKVSIPGPLRETVYDISTPRSDKKVKRHLSDRVMTPKGGRNEAVPFIKTVLNTNRSMKQSSSPAVRQSPRIFASIH